MNAQKIPLFGRERKSKYEASVRLQSPLNPIKKNPVLDEDEIANQELCERNAERSWGEDYGD